MSDSKVETTASNGNEADELKMKDATTSTSKGKAFVYAAEADIEKITGLVATAGIETEMENYNSQHSERRHYSEADEDGTSKAEPNFERVGIETETENFNTSQDSQGQHYSEAEEDVTADAKGGAGFKKCVAAAGIETKIENYENIRTQRRHFSGTDFDEVIDVAAEENAADAEDTTEADEEIAKTEETARVEQKKVDDCEGVRSHRKHFPGSTASHIFNKPYVG